MVDNSPYWTRERREIAAWLNDHAPSFADGYEGAVQLLHTPALSARVHLICHLVRDIYRYLPGVIDAKAKASPRPAEVFPGMVKELAKQWKAFPPRTVKQCEDDSSDHRVSKQVYRHIAKLVEKSEKMAEDQPTVGRALARSLFRCGVRNVDEFIAPWIIKSFDAEYDFFVKGAPCKRGSR